MARPEQRLRQMIRRNLRLDRFKAVLGDANGIVHVPNRDGYVYVRRQTATGLGAPIPVRFRAQIVTTPGRAVLLGYDSDGELAVLESDFAAVVATGGSTISDNASEVALSYTDMSKVPFLLSHVYPGAAYRVAVKSWFYVRAGAAVLFPGVSGGVDLQSFLPASAGHHLLAGLFIDLDLNAVEVAASSEQALAEPLTIDDVNECITALSASAWTPVAFWRLRNGMSALTPSDLWLDARQWINV